MAEARKRVRREVNVAKAAILAAAERHLIDEGPSGVKVQKIARELGITDAAIHYHFGNRQGLLEDLLRYSGRKFVDELASEFAVAPSNNPAANLAIAADKLADLYGGRGTAKLATWLVLSGWSPPGEGMLNGLVEWLHEGRAQWARQRGLPPPSLDESAKLIAAVSAVAFATALTGDALVRSSGLSGLDRENLLGWVADRLERTAGGD